ncbi:MAG: hypothetical protein KGY68_04915 [Candidatus Thermoplasmatota archaeon]|nr:hypothetical protein [Candidatus Thermoplasmatota archaeon]
MNRKIRTMLVAWLATMLILSVFGLAMSSVASEDDGEESDSGPPFEPPVEDGEAHRNRAENASSNGSATFLQVEDYEPWAALVINAGDPSGVDVVTVDFENDTLIIEATDSNETNHVSILINKAFADEYLAEAESDLEINTSDAVNYDGLDNSNESAGGGAMYVFHIEHFSTQTIEMSSQPFEPPVEDGETHRNRARNASANGAATFLQVEGYEPWAALVINAGDPRGIDLVTVSFENDTLIIEATDSNDTNHVSILINKAFADEYLAEAESDLEINTSDAVNYDGLDNSNESAGGGAMYVFHIEHFSTQTIEMSSQPIDPPVNPPNKEGEAFKNEAQNAASRGAATFLYVEGYEPWAALVINAGDPAGVDAVTVSFEDDTLIIEATDSNDTNHVTILVNKAFADEHLADSEGDLNIETSDAVNYDGLDNSNASAGGGAMYVFHIEHFSTQTIEISQEDSIPFLGTPMLLIAIAIPVAYYTLKKKRQ